MRRSSFGSGLGHSAVERVYVIPMICFNNQMLWQGDCMLPAPLLFQPIRYANNSYVNAVFDAINSTLEKEQDDGDDREGEGNDLCGIGFSEE